MVLFYSLTSVSYGCEYYFQKSPVCTSILYLHHFLLNPEPSFLLLRVSFSEIASSNFYSTSSSLLQVHRTQMFPVITIILFRNHHLEVLFHSFITLQKVRTQMFPIIKSIIFRNHIFELLNLQYFSRTQNPNVSYYYPYQFQKSLV